MMDYETNFNGSDEDTANFSLFIGSDPFTFDEVVKEDKWKEAIDIEILSIEKKILMWAFFLWAQIRMREELLTFQIL